MSWLYSRALVEAFSEHNCSDIDVSVRSSLTPTHNPSFWHDRMMDTSRHSRYGMTSEPLTESRGEELLTLFRGGFHAKTSVLQESKRGLMENAQDFGKKCQESLEKFAQKSYSLKTAHNSQGSGCLKSYPILPKWGTMRNGDVSERTRLELTTKENESGFLVSTPTKLMPYERTDPKTENRIRILPSGQPRKLSKNGLDGSLNWVQFLLWMEILPTPERCEFSMGFPIGWTDVRGLEMPKFQRWLDLHGIS